jgi:hypothetical protein
MQYEGSRGSEISAELAFVRLAVALAPRRFDMKEPVFSQRGQMRLASASPLMNMVRPHTFSARILRIDEQLCCVFASQYSKANPSGPVSLGRPLLALAALRQRPAKVSPRTVSCMRIFWNGAPSICHWCLAM